MLSQIHFKLRSQRPYSTVTFDGSFIALSELKKKMADRLNLLKTKASTDFELKIHDAQSNEEYVGDETHVMKNSSVLVSRLPAVNGLPKWLHDARQEKMRAEDKAAEPTIDAAASTQVLAGVAEVLGGTEAEVSEEQGLNNLMDATAKIYEKKVAANPIARYSGGGKGGQGTGIVHVVRERQPGAPEKEKAIPPPGYVCHRCKQPGHYKYDCPTADDEKFDHTRNKAIAGVPSARVRPMTTEESEKVVGRLMNDNGEFVVVLDDSDTFDKMMGSSRKTVPAVVKMPARFECPMCHKLLKDAVLTRCCQTNFCDDCIRPALMEDPACPACKKDCPPDKLIAATKLRDEIASGEWKKQMLPPAPVVAAPVKEVIPPPPPPPVIIPPPPPPPDDVPPPPPPPQVSEVPREDLENEEEVPLTREEFEALQNEHRAKIQKEKETKLRREERAEYSRNRDEGSSRRDRDEGSRRNRDEGSSRRDRDEGNRDEGSRRNRDEGHGRGRDEGNRRDRDEGNRRGKDEGNRRGKDEGNMRGKDEGNRRDRSSGRDDEHQLEKQESQQHNSPKRHSRGLSDNKDGVVKTSSGLILTDARQRIARARESKKAETKHDHQEERRERRDRDKDDKRSKRRDREDKQDRRAHSSKKHKKDKEHKRSFQESKPVQDRSKRSRSGSADDGRKKSRPNRKDDDTRDAKEEAWGQDRWDPHDDEDMNLTI